MTSQGYFGPQTLQLRSISRWSSPTRPITDNGPIPPPGRWFVYYPGTRQPSLSLFRRHLPPSMLLVDHIMWSILIPLQYLVQRRGSILEALYRICEGLWFNLAELVMTSLFHFKDKFHSRNLTRAETIPLLFPRLLCQVLEHIGFPVEPRLERYQDCDVILTVDRWKIMPRSYHLPPPDLAEDQPAVDLPTE